MKLLSTEKKEKSTVELTIEVGEEEFEAALEAAYRKERSKITVPGFRRGKASRKMIERMLGESYFWEDAVEASYPAAYDAALAESGIDAVGPGQMNIVNIDSDGYVFMVLVPVRPEITLGEWKGIEAPLYSVSVGEEEANDEIERMRRRNARIETVDRPIVGGDIAVIDFEGLIDGVPFEGGQGENYELEVGSQRFIPGFEEQLVGVRAGAEVEVHVTFPDEYHAEELAGKTAVFNVKVREVKEHMLPEADDEFAKDVSEFDTLDELRKDIEKRIREEREESIRQSFENAVMDELAARVRGAIPDVMVDDQIEGQMENVAYRLQTQGVNLETYMKVTGTDIEEMRRDLRPRAEEQVRLGLALDKIVKDEGIEVTQEELDAKYNEFSELYNMPMDQVKIVVKEESLRRDLSREKASKLVLENAVGVDPDFEGKYWGHDEESDEEHDEETAEEPAEPEDEAE